MEAWFASAIFMIFIASSKLYKLSEDDVEALVTSKPVNFGNFNHATVSPVEEINEDSFRPSKELFLIPGKNFQKFEFQPENIDVFPQLQPTKNMYKQLLMLHNRPEHNYDDESEEVDDVYNIYSKRKHPGLIYGKQKPIDLYSFQFNNERFKKSKSNGYENMHKKKRNQHSYKLQQDVNEPIPKMESLSDYFSKQRNPDFHFDDEFLQQKNHFNQKEMKQQFYGNNKYKDEFYRNKKGMGLDNFPSEDKKKARWQTLRDLDYRSNICNLRN